MRQFIIKKNSFQLFEVNEKMGNVERFAKETAEKCAEISDERKTSKRCKQIDQLKESNTQLKDVNFCELRVKMIVS